MKKRKIERKVIKVEFKSDHLEVHYSDGSIIKTINFTDGNCEYGISSKEK